MSRHQPARSLHTAAGYRALQRVSAVVRSEIDLGRALDLLAAEVGGLLDLSLCAVARWEESGQRLVFTHEYARGCDLGSGPLLRGRRHAPSSDPEARHFDALVFGEGRPWLRPALGALAGAPAAPPVLAGLDGSAVVAAPMSAARGVVGLLVAARPGDLLAWTEEEVEYLKACADLGAVAIQHVAARATARSLSAAAVEANAGAPLESTLRRLVETAVLITRSSGGLIARRDGERIACSHVRGARGWQPDTVVFERGRGLGGWSWLHRAPCVANEAGADPRADPEEVRERKLRSCLTVPLVSPRGEVLGLLEVHDRLAGTQYGEEEIHLASAVAHLAALAMRADNRDGRD